MTVAEITAMRGAMVDHYLAAKGQREEIAATGKWPMRVSECLMGGCGVCHNVATNTGEEYELRKGVGGFVKALKWKAEATQFAPEGDVMPEDRRERPDIWDWFKGEGDED